MKTFLVIVMVLFANGKTTMWDGTPIKLGVTPKWQQVHSMEDCLKAANQDKDYWTAMIKPKLKKDEVPTSIQNWCLLKE